ncbi:Hpt domain-containing protein [Parendozoicomonas sp. Alg238-R29]|uniref:Hpt domain-containing protein n=1 Tax=Parendozoicomonas sp. Alg238-R29 TaxID=2993446 RepID=UPI00248ED6BC|nr:Hpt domain-containing protein [Parendozoicomonas sp. Alg238-R29]
MLNLDVLKDVVGDDPALMMDMLQKFIETTQEDMQNLQDALAASNSRDVASFAHRIKGSCFVVGASELAEIADTLERDGRQDKTSDFPVLAEQISSAFRDVRQAIEKL